MKIDQLERASPRLDLDALLSFVTVADCGGFRRAADLLQLAQATVSQHVLRLEHHLGRRLLLRTTRRVRLTDDGEVLLEHARRLLEAEEVLRTRLVAPRISGRVRLGASEEVAATRLPPILARFARLYPDVLLEVDVGTSAELIRSCEEGAVDVALIKRPIGSSKGEPLWREDLLWAAAPDYQLSAGNPVPLALYRQENSISRAMALHALRHVGLPFRIAYTSYSLVGLRAAALAGLAVAAMPASMLGEGLHALGPASGMPALQSLDYILMRRAARSGDEALDAMCRTLLSMRKSSDVKK